MNHEEASHPPPRPNCRSLVEHNRLGMERPRCHRQFSVPVSFLAAIGLCLGSSASGSEWTQYRGPNHDGISTDHINTDWEGAATNAIWKATTRNGFSSFAVSGGRAITQVRQSVGGFPKEVCLALSITNGLELWSTVIDDALYDAGSGPDDGPRTTPSIDAAAVYVLSSNLKLVRLNPADGAVVWERNPLVDYGGKLIPWQNGASPLLESGRIFLNVNCGTFTIIALRTADGGLAWRSQESEAMTHSTPVIADIGGVRQVIFAAQKGLVALDPSTGKRLWYFAYPFRYSTSLAVSPVVYRDKVFISGANGMGSCAVEVSFTNDTWSAHEIWSNSLASPWMTPVCHQGYIYGHFGSSSLSPLKCISMETGAEMWSTDGFGRGGTLLVDGHVVALTEDGMLLLVQPRPDAYAELGRFQAVTGKCWNVPAFSDGCLYVRSTREAACFDMASVGSVPLRLRPEYAPAIGPFRFSIAKADGSPIDANARARIQLFATTNLTAGPEGWQALTPSFSLTNGELQVDDPESLSLPQRFYRAEELP